MGLFSKSIPDEDWLLQASPSYEAARPLGIALSDAIRQENLEAQITAAQDVLQKFPVIRDAVKRLPSPTGAEARQAKKNLESALKNYVDGAGQGTRLFRDMAGGLGERIASGGFAARAATGRFAFQKSIFDEIVSKAARAMEQASKFLSRRG